MHSSFCRLKSRKSLENGGAPQQSPLTLVFVFWGGIFLASCLFEDFPCFSSRVEGVLKGSAEETNKARAGGSVLKSVGNSPRKLGPTNTLKKSRVESDQSQ